MLKKAQLHAKQVVHLRDFVAARHQAAHFLYAVHFVDMERGFDRPTAAKVHGIDVPSLFNIKVEDNFAFSSFARFELCG